MLPARSHSRAAVLLHWRRFLHPKPLRVSWSPASSSLGCHCARVQKFWDHPLSCKLCDRTQDRPVTLGPLPIIRHLSSSVSKVNRHFKSDLFKWPSDCITVVVILGSGKRSRQVRDAILSAIFLSQACGGLRTWRWNPEMSDGAGMSESARRESGNQW